MSKKWDREIRETTRGIARAWGQMAPADAGSQPADERAGDEIVRDPVVGHPRLTLGEPGSWSRVLLAYWSWILLITVLVTVGAGALAEMQTPIYKSQAEVAVYAASSAGNSAVQSYVMGTEKRVASSGAVLSVASQSLLISVGNLQHGLSITVPAETDLLVISYSDPNPQVAQSVADGVAQAYVAYRSSKASPLATGNTPATPVTTTPVQAAVITYAALPTSPVSPNRLLIIGAALLLGLALGIGMALLRDAMDDGLRGAVDLQLQTDIPVLAQIPRFQRKRRSVTERLVIMRNSSSCVAEAYRNLRTRVLQVAGWRSTNLLLITSPGREDKATVAANLAAALALSGRRVVLLCADLRWGRTHALFGLATRPGLAKVVNGAATLDDALRWTEVPRLQVLPGGPPAEDPSSVLQSTAFRNLLAQLRREADFVVIDAPPVLASADTAALAELGAMILLVADARASTRAELRDATQQLGHVRDQLIGCVLDNVGRSHRLRQPSKPPVLSDVDAARTWSQPGSGAAWDQDILDQPMTSERGLSAAPAGGPHPELKREPEATAIHGEV